MLPFRRVGTSVIRALELAAPSTQKLLYSSAVPLNEPLSPDFVLSKGTVKGSQSPQVTTLDNGVKVASVESNGPVSKVGVFIDGGSRFETESNLGVTHFLRNAAFTSSENTTAFMIARTSEQCGATVEATSSRDHLVFSADCKRDSVNQVVGNLCSVVSGPLFNPWEIEDVAARVKLDLAVTGSQPQVAVLEELHRAAYRRNLGNSVYCLPHRVGKVSSGDLLSFSKKYFVGSGVALVGIGVDHEEFVQQAQNALGSLEKGTAPSRDSAKYFGGESVSHKPYPVIHAAVVNEGAGLNSKDLLAYSVLQRVLGTTSFIKWGSNTATSRVNKAASEVSTGPFFASSLNMNYVDSGLFGLYVIATPADIGKVLKATVGQLESISKGDVKDAEIARAKNQLKANVFMESESKQAAFENLGAQVLIKGSYTPSSDVVKAVDSVSKDDILSVAKRLLATKLTMSAVGDVTNVPHLDELL